jgi:hypothetical protein
MRREEAEREAQRRNDEDPGRGRYEFYAFDESAGMADDAWDVSARLRQDASEASDWPEPGPQTAAAGGPPEEEPLTLGGPTLAEIDPFAGPDFAEPPPPEAPVPVPEQVPAQEEDAPDDPFDFEHDRRDRGGWFVKSVGVLVVVTGLAWIGLIVLLTVVLKPNSTTSVSAFVGLGVLGALAVLLGAIILRS